MPPPEPPPEDPEPLEPPELLVPLDPLEPPELLEVGGVSVSVGWLEPQGNKRPR
jgi:hypothetical protein